MSESQPELEWQLHSGPQEWRDLATACAPSTGSVLSPRGLWRENRFLILLVVFISCLATLREAYAWQTRRAHSARLAEEILLDAKTETATRPSDVRTFAYNLIDGAIDRRWQKRLMLDRFPQHLAILKVKANYKAPPERLKRATSELHHGAPNASTARWGDTGTRSSIDFHWDIDVQEVEIRKNFALVQIQQHLSGPNVEPQTFRALRIYRLTNAGWKQTAPTADLWGPSQTLHTKWLQLRFRERDAEVVAALADRLDAFYERMQASVGRWPPQVGEAAIVEIDALEAPIRDRHLMLRGSEITVPSPALTVAPVEFSQEEILYNTVAIQLAQLSLNQVNQSASSRTHGYDLGAAINGGLRLWLIWDAGGALVGSQPEIVAWRYRNFIEDSRADRPHHLDSRAQICQRLSVLNLSPLAIDISLNCTSRERNDLYVPPLDLHLRKLRDPLIAFSDPNYEYQMQSNVVAAATLFAYVEAEYDRGRVALLIHELGSRTAWGTLVPAVFDVSVEEFESGWWTYLRKTYGVTIP